MLKDFAQPIRRALIDGGKSPALSLETKRYAAKRELGDKYIGAGGKADWSRPTVLTAWIANRPGSIERTAGC